MTEADAVQAISNAFVAGWATAQPSVPTFLSNEAGAAPDQWVYLSVTPPAQAQTSMGPPGSKREQFKGYIAVQIFSAVDVGDKPSAALADSVRTVLANKSFAVGGESVDTFSGASQRGASDGRWNMRVVVIPYVFWGVA